MLEQFETQKLLEKVKELFDEAVAYDSGWQRNAREAFEFRDNNQWDKQEHDILKEERRPALTLNVIKSHIDLIMGLNEDIKKRYICSPVSVDDGFLCEVINNVIYWLYQKNDWDSEEDNAYESALICGRGWLGIDYDIDEKSINDIKITLTSIPIHEIRVDPAARKRDLSDASYIIWDRWLSLEDFCIKYPLFEGKAREAFSTNAWPRMDVLGEMIGEVGRDINDESDYSDPLDITYFDSKKRQMRICHMEYWKYEKVYFVRDPKADEWRQVEEPWEQFKSKWALAFPNEELVYETQNQKNVYWLQFCGEDILTHTKSPIHYPGFSIIPCFLYGDVSRRNGYHFGLVELMKDAQREINKRTSQTLNLFNQQVQPGIYAEPRAFINTDQAEQSLKEAGSITWLQDGAIGQNRFKERDIPQFPSVVLQMGEYAREMLRHITGINPDLLGMNDKRQEPGIVVQLRQQQGMSILKSAFRAYSEMKKQVFERLVRIVMAHMPMKQLQKIMGEGERYQVQGTALVDSQTNLSCDFRNINNIAYDIDAEPESNSMTANALEAATYIEMQKNGFPVDPKVIISKTNLAMSEKLAWMEFIESSQQAQSEAAQQEFELEKMKIEYSHQEAMAKLELDSTIAKQKLEDSEQKEMLKTALAREQLDVQKNRDAQSAQLKLMQIMAGAMTNGEEAKRKMTELMINSDLDKKRLILDIVEVMTNASWRGIELKAKAVTDMYREALKSSTLEKAEESRLAGKIFDVLTRGTETAVMAQKDLRVAGANAVAGIESEKIKAETQKQISKEGAKVASNDKTRQQTKTS